MQFPVLGIGHNRQVGNVVILFVAVDVMNDVAVGNFAKVVRPHRTVKVEDFEIVPIVIGCAFAVGDAVELLMRFIDLLDFETIAIDFVD